MEILAAIPDEWSQLSMAAFEQAAYGEDEPDISHILVREPNPAYTPWKNGKPQISFSRNSKVSTPSA